MDKFLDNAPCCYFSFGDNGLLLQVNQTLCSLTGYEKNELEGSKVEVIFTIATRIFFQTHFFPLLKMQEFANEIFISLLAKNGTHLPVLVCAKKETFDGKIHYVCTGIIVENRKKFEDELVSAKKAAEAALRENTELIQVREELTRHSEMLDEQLALAKSQNTELKEFSRILAHELQEPIRKMSLFMDLLRTSVRPGLEITDAKNFDRLLKVFGQLWSRMEGLQKYTWLNDTSTRAAAVDLNTLLAEAEKQLQKDFAPDLLQLKAEKLPELKADRDQLFILLHQLLVNAIQFRKKDEPAFVTISGTILQQNRFKLVKNRYKYEDYLKLQITDRGIGFASHQSKRAFELFRKLHDTDGLGLGLALCKKIVENHYGEIEAVSKPDEGTTITILLPIDYTRVEAEANQEPVNSL